MATPLGHGLAGLTVGVATGNRSRLLGFATLGLFAGIAPDLDFVPGLLMGDPARFHQGPSHSIAAALSLGLLVALLAPSAQRLRAGLIATGGYLSHLGLDLLTYDPTPPRGAPLLWPLLEEPIRSPLMVLPRVLHSVVSPFNLHNLHVMAIELGTIGLALLVAVYVRTRNEPGAPVSEEAP